MYKRKVGYQMQVNVSNAEEEAERMLTEEAERMLTRRPNDC